MPPGHPVSVAVIDFSTRRGLGVSGFDYDFLFPLNICTNFPRRPYDFKHLLGSNETATERTGGNPDMVRLPIYYPVQAYIALRWTYICIMDSLDIS